MRVRMTVLWNTVPAEDSRGFVSIRGPGWGRDSLGMGQLSERFSDSRVTQGLRVIQTRLVSLAAVLQPLSREQ